ncbi:MULTISPECIES: hypothetical protein [unclassified Pantoea]|uniref:hypothetical protein n=1 Tax=unclassified Pantoea TaxID=2630326 RepID=UPI001CC21112|nr:MULTISPECIES: hypothetical protein [unclassified Pantoea]
MKICFPARKANGEQYATVDEMMQLLCQEPHGAWLAATNNMWHGGIHITSESAPGSVLTNETADTAVPLQFMAGGEVVAWRINQDYLTGKYISNPLQYSSTFVLVKSTCTPDPEKKDNSLDFYSLYTGLAPLSAFPKHRLYQVTKKGDGLRKREYTGKEKAGDKAPIAKKNKLKAGDSVIVLRETTFDLEGQAQTFGLARALNSKSEMTGGAFWVSLDSQFVTPVGEQRAHLPAWMQQAVAQGTSDTVVKPATRLEVAAGDAVGYLAEDIAPCDLHGVEKSAFAHIEVLSTDRRMLDFLSNKAQVQSGPKYIHIHPESSVYARAGDNFTKTEGKVKKDIHKIMPQDKCHPFKDSSGRRWFDIGDGAWVSEDDVDADINQYDLDKLGFKAFEEPSTSDMTKSLREGWVKEGFTRMAEWVRPDRGIREKQVSDYYKALLRKMDSDNSGDLSGEELRLAVNYAELDVRDIAARMVVKHDSEWFGGSSHHRWTTFLKQLDPLCISYVRKWFDDMEWMSQVDGFSSGKPVWHMHPVVFLSALKETACDCELKYADKFKVTRYGTQYGPIYSGTISLDKYPRWEELLKSGEITEDEKDILIAMSQNEGNMDAIQSYDSEVITAGAMQKTVKDGAGLEGKGELSAQIASFRDSHSDLYVAHAVNCGWTVEGSGTSSIVYYSDAELTGGKKITATELKHLIRNGCSETTFRKVIHNKPLAALVKLISLPEYLDLQVLDFVKRLHHAENGSVGNGAKIKDYAKSNFGRALVLDESVNRLANVTADFKEAIKNFHSHNPSINSDPKTWGAQHESNERLLLDEYRLTRRMTDSTKRYNQLKAKL